MPSEAWSPDALWRKACRSFELAQASADPEIELLWSAIALEFLAKAALSTTHPALLADVKKQGAEGLLHVFGAPEPASGFRSAPLEEVLKRLRALHPAVPGEIWDHCTAFARARNEEIHSGSLGFARLDLGSSHSRFYQAAAALIELCGRGLNDMFDAHRAAEVKESIAIASRETKENTHRLIAEAKRLFRKRPATDRKSRKLMAASLADSAARSDGHRVTCPACESAAIVQGTAVESRQVVVEHNEVVVRSTTFPKRFQCFACELRLTSVAELQVAELNVNFTRTERYSQADYGADFFDELQVEEYENE